MCELTVMVVESNQKDLQIICEELIKSEVYKLLCVEETTDAKDYLLIDRDLDILIVSQEEGQDEGIRLIEFARSVNPRIQCILCERSEDITSGLLARTRGAHDYVRKNNLNEQLSIVVPHMIYQIELYNRLF